MLFTPISFALAVLCITGHAAPTMMSALDSSTLLQNGQAAQQQNAEFQSLKITDPCSTGQTACISGATAKCQNNAWTTTPCPSNTQCFALPEIKSNGTLIACSSVAQANSVIAATGAQGGFASTSGSNSTTGLFNPNDNDNGQSTSAQSTSTESGNAGVVTLTFTIAPSTLITLPPATQTISPAEASILISELGSSSNAATSTSSVSTSTTTITVLPTATIDNSGDGVTASSQSNSSGSNTQSIIILSTTPISQVTSSAVAAAAAEPVITLAAQISAAPSTPASGDGY